MERLKFMSNQEAMTRLLTKVHSLVQYDQLAAAYFRFHVDRAKYYLRRSALLMVISLACTAWITLGGPKTLVLPAAGIPLMLLLLRVDRKVSFHLQASAEYLFSKDDFENLVGSAWLPEVITTFERRCALYGPTHLPLNPQNEKLTQDH